jgi:hypothetical protein
MLGHELGELLLGVLQLLLGALSLEIEEIARDFAC